MRQMLMRRVRLIHDFVMNLLRLLGTARKNYSPFDAGVGDAGDAAGRRGRLFGVDVDVPEGVRWRRRMRRRG